MFVRSRDFVLEQGYQLLRTIFACDVRVWKIIMILAEIRTYNLIGIGQFGVRGVLLGLRHPIELMRWQRLGVSPSGQWSHGWGCQGHDLPHETMTEDIVQTTFRAGLWCMSTSVSEKLSILASLFLCEVRMSRNGCRHFPLDTTRSWWVILFHARNMDLKPHLTNEKPSEYGQVYPQAQVVETYLPCTLHGLSHIARTGGTRISAMTPSSPVRA